MNEHNLLWICLNAFLAVMGLLSLLALFLRLLITLFAEKPAAKSDPAIASAIASSVNSAWPGARVTRIEEIH
jgi:hypothetical protein